MNKWQPIETIPKDGSLILCWYESPVYSGYALLKFNDPYWYDEEDRSGYIEYNIMKWCPILSSPKKEHKCIGNYCKCFTNESGGLNFMVDADHMQFVRQVRFCPFCGFEDKEWGKRKNELQ